MENKVITEDILLKNGFKNNENGTVISYVGKKCTIDMWYCGISIGNRGHWHFQMFSEDEKYALADAIIQTVEQFNKLIDALNADCEPLKC